MAAKKKPAPRKKAADTAHPASSVARVAMRNLINMAVVTASCATTLLTLMAVLTFQGA